MTKPSAPSARRVPELVHADREHEPGDAGGMGEEQERLRKACRGPLARQGIRSNEQRGDGHGDAGDDRNDGGEPRTEERLAVYDREVDDGDDDVDERRGEHPSHQHLEPVPLDWIHRRLTPPPGSPSP